MKTEDIKKMAQAWNAVQEASYGKKKTEASDTQMGTITVKTDAERKARAQAYRDKKAKNEELKGNQHKIDHNKDGKISAADFKGLRKKAKKDQEVEVQTSEAKIDEISKKTLGSYVKKASSDMANNAYALGARDPLKKPGSWDKAFKRKAGIAKATDKLTKEEIELDEVLDTPKAMARYRDKATASRDAAASSAIAKDFRSKDKETRDHPAKELKTMAKRTAGLRMVGKKAADKLRKDLTKESVEEAATHNPGVASPAGEGLSPSAKDQLAKKTPAPSDAFDANVVNKKTFDAMRASAKKAPMRNNDNAKGDKNPPKAK